MRKFSLACAQPLMTAEEGPVFIILLLCLTIHCSRSTKFRHACSVALITPRRAHRQNCKSSSRTGRASINMKNSREHQLSHHCALCQPSPPLSTLRLFFRYRVSSSHRDTDKFPSLVRTSIRLSEWRTVARRLTDDDEASRRSSFVLEIFNRKY